MGSGSLAQSTSWNATAIDSNLEGIQGNRSFQRLSGRSWHHGVALEPIGSNRMSDQSWLQFDSDD
jgi:hypothetical protein